MDGVIFAWGLLALALSFFSSVAAIMHCLERQPKLAIWAIAISFASSGFAGWALS